jgi:hypothetical protein
MAAVGRAPAGRTPGFRVCRVYFSRWALGSIVLIRYKSKLITFLSRVMRLKKPVKPGNPANSVATVCYRTRSNLLGVAQ